MNSNVTLRISSPFCPDRPMKSSFLFRFGFCLLALALAGCGKSDHSDASEKASHSVQKVGVVTLTPQRVAINEELPRRLARFAFQMFALKSMESS